MEDEDDAITIDHLVGVACILNASVKVELRKNRKKDNRIELFTDNSNHYLLIGEVLDMTADGGFVISLTSRRGEVLSNKGHLIAEALFSAKKSKGATI